jgi:hypothetical protein
MGKVNRENLRFFERAGRLKFADIGALGHQGAEPPDR